MNVQSILDELRSASSQKHKANVVRLGIPEANSLGVPMPVIRSLAKTLRYSNSLSWQLWATEIHEARLLACLVFEPGSLSHEQLGALLDDVVSWDLCDHLCGSVFAADAHYQQLILGWAGAEKTYVKRAAFALIATQATHQRALGAELIDQWLGLVEQYSDDGRTHVKKAVSWALRELGHIDIPARDRALEAASRLTQSSSAARRWVGADASRELTDLVFVPGRRRLVSAKSKAARAAGR
ncbi:DNA alkylation repair protein [Glutamicibacter sp.]|uniref:DNA alkylation repair protein n=1 Tax=Glutamicibacter sp. TaxID=1931995 RepID=UPI0028BEEA00|nr:DNA alkylation repair protein [Glutamicibacter sp.]